MGFDSLGEVLVGVPRMIIGVGDLGPNDFYDTRSSFNKAACEEAAIPKSILTVSFTGLVTLLFKSEGFAGTAAHNEVKGTIVVFIKRVFFDRFVDGRHLCVDGISKAGAAF